MSWTLLCPECGGPLVERDDALLCDRDDSSFPRRRGVWDLLPPAEKDRWRDFLADYETERSAGGWAIEDPAELAGLPYRAPGGRHREIWRLRARSYETLCRHLESRRRGAAGLRILDLGAGNGWLALRLATRGHEVAAVDLSLSRSDGLGTLERYPERAAVLGIRAGFDHLPLASEQADLAIFNGSLHYSTDYHRSLAEASRTLRRGGAIVVLDSPTYREASSGVAMRSELRPAVESGGESAELPDHEGFVTTSRLRSEAENLGLELSSHPTEAVWRSTTRRIRARLESRREPATFPMYILEAGPARSA